MTEVRVGPGRSGYLADFFVRPEHCGRGPGFEPAISPMLRPGPDA